MSLYQSVRPTSLDHVVGQEEAVVILRKAVAAADRQHAYLFHGPSGCGKTTMARILARELGCDVKPEGSVDYDEVNASDARGIDDMRRIVRDSMYPPITGTGVRVVVIDEVHQATKDAMNCLLKPLEDPPAHQYYLLCTTEPTKLLPTIRTRCVHVPVKALAADDVFDLLVDTVKRHSLANPGDEVLDAIAERADGCPRSALNMLEQCLGLPLEKALKAISNFRSKEQAAFGLCQLLLRGEDWTRIASAYNGVEDKDPEGLRRMMLGYFKSCLLKSKKPTDAARFVGVIEELANNTYDSGEAALLAMLWRAARVGKE